MQRVSSVQRDQTDQLAPKFSLAPAHHQKLLLHCTKRVTCSSFLPRLGAGHLGVTIHEHNPFAAGNQAGGSPHRTGPLHSTNPFTCGYTEKPTKKPATQLGAGFPYPTML
jgi:hypothetical protein